MKKNKEMRKSEIMNNNLKKDKKKQLKLNYLNKENKNNENELSDRKNKLGTDNDLDGGTQE